MEHTKEPWPVFTDIAVMMTPDPESTPAAILSWDDYIRARACVNACAWISTDELVSCPTGGVFKLAVHYSPIAKQYAELLSAIVLILPMAKGYASEHPVGSNDAYCNQAELAIANTK